MRVCQKLNSRVTLLNNCRFEFQNVRLIDGKELMFIKRRGLNIAN